MAAFEQWRLSREPWWDRHWVPWNHRRQALYCADKCLCKRKWRWKYHRKRDEISSLVRPYSKFPQLCDSVEPHRDHVGAILLTPRFFYLKSYLAYFVQKNPKTFSRLKFNYVINFAVGGKIINHKVDHLRANFLDNTKVRLKLKRKNRNHVKKKKFSWYGIILSHACISLMF